MTWRALFIGPYVMEAINEDLATQPAAQRFVVNCASQEYFKSVRPKLLTEGVELYNMAGGSLRTNVRSCPT
jgi:cytoplasmic iron level regulating protein YaaA (DUF328/UPF0246 family)